MQVHVIHFSFMSEQLNSGSQQASNGGELRIIAIEIIQ